MIDVLGPLAGAAALITVVLTAWYRIPRRAAIPLRRRAPRARRTA
jgi:hypothetical protein